jgi:hypothetical protein
MPTCRPSLSLACCILSCLAAARSTAAPPTVFVLDGPRIAGVRESVLKSPREYEAALQEIRANATDALTAGPWSVMDKRLVPPSGDKHDYYSVGPYWWPDPAKPDGLPYIRRDGEVNPERYEYDSAGLKNVVASTRALALAWYFTGEARYAERAALLLRTWFLDLETKMNPHLQYGQAIPGRTEGRGIGIIDTARLIDLVDSVGLLQTSDAWSAADHRQLQAWFRAYLQWLLTSAHGLDEAKTRNNHAVWYDAQIASFALLVDDRETARETLERVGSQRIATQIETDGRMPHELARTKSFSYTAMNLRGFLHLARLAEHVQVDLWNFRTSDGRSIEAALDWLAPFVAGRKQWTHQQISPMEPSSAFLLYRRAAWKLDKPMYRQLGSQVTDPIDLLLWPEA